VFEVASDAVGSAPGAWALLFAFIIGHMLGDFPLQGDFLALGKVRGYWIGPDAPAGASPGMWLYCLTAHSLIQAGIVWIISGSVILGVAELVLHWLTDYGKGEGKFGFALDQGFHLGAKVVFSVMIYLGVIPLI